MAKGPQKQKRPADVIGCAITVAKIATGDIIEELPKPSGKTKNGKAGSRARANRLTKQERSAIAQKAAKARWAK